MVKTMIFYLLCVGINNMTAFVMEKLGHAWVFIEDNVQLVLYLNCPALLIILTLYYKVQKKNAPRLYGLFAQILNLQLGRHVAW